MNILLCSHCFAPQVGGTETVAMVLAMEWSRAGHSVTVITQTPGEDAADWPFKVIRRPSQLQLLHEARWCDVYFQNNISLQTIWPAFFLRKPLVVSHHTWIAALGGRQGWRERMKRALLRFSRNITPSQAMALDLGVEADVLGNPYDDGVFRRRESTARELELICVSRLVSEKGVDVLLSALALLRAQGIQPRLTIVGDGPEEERLRDQAQNAHMDEQVEFAGPLRGEALAAALNRHEIVVIPSRCAETFGIVALEGIACGCVVVGADSGGLPEAIGPCGLTFAREDAPGLASVLMRVLTDLSLRQSLRAGCDAHLTRFRPQKVAAAYLGIFQTVTS